MANPLRDGCNLVGTLVFAASNSTGAQSDVGSTELGVAIGTSLTGGATSKTNDVSLPSREFSCIFLVKLSSGPCTFTADVSSGGSSPTFSGDRASSVTDSTAGAPVFVGPVISYAPTQSVSDGDLSTSTVNNKVALKFNPTNTATVQKLCLLATMTVGPKHTSNTTIKKAFHIQGPPVATGCDLDKTGKWFPL